MIEDRKGEQRGHYGEVGRAVLNMDLALLHFLGESGHGFWGSQAQVTTPVSLTYSVWASPWCLEGVHGSLQAQEISLGETGETRDVTSA